MAFQSRKSSQTDEKDVGIESDEHSSSWETLRFQDNSPSPLKFDESKDQGKIYFKTPERKVNRKLSFLETGIDTPTFYGKSAVNSQKFLPKVSTSGVSVLASSPLENSKNRSSRVKFSIPNDISKISPVESSQNIHFHESIEKDKVTPPEQFSEKFVKMADDDDIIIVEENGETPKKKHVTFGVTIENQSGKELCTFQREIITEHDYKTLADEEYLNDNIINFYLTWLYEKLSDKHKSMIHMYSSYFYSRLKSKPRKKNKHKHVDKTKTKAEQEYERVKSWTKKIDIFEKRMLIIPICEESHWYLVIVCNPGHVLSQSREKDFEKKRKYQKDVEETKGRNPFIMVLDSLGGSHSTAVSKIRSYLMMEHLEKRKLPKNFGKDKMGEKHPPIPYQPNSCDCGLFLLHYVELIFRDPDVFLGAILPDLSKWFNTSDVEYKREDIANLIKEVASQDNSRKVKFPKIKMPSREEKEEDRKKRPDPRLRKSKDENRKMKEGSLGELLETDRPKRSAKFKGSYKDQCSPDRSSIDLTTSSSPTRKSARLATEETPKSPSSSRSTTPETPPSATFSSPTNGQGVKLFDSLISFEVKRPEFHKNVKKEIVYEEYAPKLVLNRVDDNNGLEENDAINSGSGGWNTVGDAIKNKPNETEDKFQRFLLKRNNPDTNPEEIRKKTSNSERPSEEIRKKPSDSERPVQSQHEMLNLLMRGSKKKKSKK